MITTVNKKISMDKDLLSRIKWACTFSNCVSKIKNAQLLLQSGYSGFGIDLKDIDKKEIEWAGEI